jgi:hypothetical protein
MDRGGGRNMSGNILFDRDLIPRELCKGMDAFVQGDRLWGPLCACAEVLLFAVLPL